MPPEEQPHISTRVRELVQADPVAAKALWEYLNALQLRRRYDEQRQQREAAWQKDPLWPLISLIESAPFGMQAGHLLAEGSVETRRGYWSLLFIHLAYGSSSEWVNSLIEDIEALPEKKQSHAFLIHGLRHLDDDNLSVLDALPALIIGLEGSLWHTAKREGYTWPSHKNPPGVEKPIKFLWHDEDHLARKFLVERVYGGIGNPYRHGTQEDLGHEQIFHLIVGAAFWLDRHHNTDLRQQRLSRLLTQIYEHVVNDFEANRLKALVLGQQI